MFIVCVCVCNPDPFDNCNVSVLPLGFEKVNDLRNRQTNSKDKEPGYSSIKQKNKKATGQETLGRPNGPSVVLGTVLKQGKNNGFVQSLNSPGMDG